MREPPDATAPDRRFGFKFDGSSVAAGVVATALAFGPTLLALVYLIGPISGCLGPALIVGGTALSQVWLFIVAPLIGGALAAGLHQLFYRDEDAGLAAEAQQS